MASFLVNRQWTIVAMVVWVIAGVILVSCGPAAIPGVSTVLTPGGDTDPQPETWILALAPQPTDPRAPVPQSTEEPPTEEPPTEEPTEEPPTATPEPETLTPTPKTPTPTPEPPTEEPPTATDLTSTVDAGGEVSITFQGSDVETCELTFATADPSSGTLSSITDQSCQSGSPNSDIAVLT
jgi:outer membrane biosynthesis protein TonB